MPKPAPKPICMGPPPFAGAAVFGHLRHTVGGLELHVLVQIADRPHCTTGVNRLLDLFRRRDGVDEEVDQLQAILAEVVGHLGPGRAGDFVVLGRKIEDTRSQRAHQIGQRRETIRSRR